MAISHECDYPASILHLPRATHSLIDSSQSSEVIDQQVKRHLQLGLDLYSLNESLLQELQPDVILTQAQCDVCAIRYADVCRFVSNSPPLKNAGIVSLSPNSLVELWSDIRRVAAAIGSRDAG